MARIRNSKQYDDSKSRLLNTGMELIRSESFAAIGINDILKKSDVPRGSFYHYFESKEAFGLAVAQHYHDEQLHNAKEILGDKGKPALKRLVFFFQQASKEFENRNYSDGCLMCNLTTELADTNNAFQKSLQKHWRELSSEIATCLAQLNKADIGLQHLANDEAADWLLNAWSGALVRMKAERNVTPLKLFEKTIFGINKDNSQ